MFCCVLAAALVFFLFLTIKPLLLLRADLLLWAETDFVNNMIKLNRGIPLYTAPSDGNSLIYNPAAFLATYGISWLIGQTKSIAAWRLIQLGFTICAALVAVACAFKLRRLAFPDSDLRYRRTWILLIFLAMLLAATAPYSNQYVYALHVDALALLVSIGAFWSVLRYVEKDSLKNLTVMALFPALGFLTKQFLISWGAVMLVFLILYHPKRFRRHGIFIVLSGALVLTAFGACYLIWGDNYLFWTVEVMGGDRKNIVLSPDSFSLSVTRGLDHLARIWLEIFVGIAGVWLMLRSRNFTRLAPVFAAWFLLVLSEALSSGAGWNTLYHFGPGVLIGATFMFAALPEIWSDSGGDRHDERSLSPEPSPKLKNWSKAFVMVAAVIAVFSAWNVVPNGNRYEARYMRGYAVSPDLERYLSEIEHEFEALPAERVLMGVGSWIYLRHDILQKDRAVSLADQPLRGMYENFDVTVQRIRDRAYLKILVHDFHSPFFLYEWADWKKPSGFRQALLENYVEIKTIMPPESYPMLSEKIVFTGPVSVFVPKE